MHPIQRVNTIIHHKSLVIFVWVSYNIHSFNILNKWCLNPLCALGNVCSPKKTLEDKADIDPALTELIYWDRQRSTQAPIVERENCCAGASLPRGGNINAETCRIRGNTCACCKARFHELKADVFLPADTIFPAQGKTSHKELQNHTGKHYKEKND